MHHRTLLQGRAHRAVQAVLEVQVPLPPHHVGEQIAVEGAVLTEQVEQIQLRLGGDEVIEAELLRREFRPLGQRQVVLGIGPGVPDSFEDPAPILRS